MVFELNPLVRGCRYMLEEVASADAIEPYHAQEEARAFDELMARWKATEHLGVAQATVSPQNHVVLL
jgi:hypothetical protein